MNICNEDKRNRSGFTIVELLIVIVVIGILAAITIVAYNGIQTRATNTTTVTAANQAVKAIQSSSVVNDGLPGETHVCLTSNTDCNWSGTAFGKSNAGQRAIIEAITTTATLAKTAPGADATHQGLIYNYVSGRTMSGQSAPAVLVFFLKGNNVNCELGNVTNSGGSTMGNSSTGYTASSNGVTTCVVSIRV